MPLPDKDFDVTEVAVPWKLLTEAGHQVTFATERGRAAPKADSLLLTGVVFGQLGAEAEAKAFYSELERSAEFQNPIAWGDVVLQEYDGLILAGGHAPGMRQYLGSVELQQKVAEFFCLHRPVGAICHGVLVATRARDESGHSPLRGHKTTCLPKYMERTAYWLTAWHRGRYYRTYPAYVEDEVTAALEKPTDFVRGPTNLVTRGSRDDDTHAFVVVDGMYVSARWPGDAYLFAKTFLRKLPGAPSK